jgi:uncharacterized membrane protein
MSPINLPHVHLLLNHLPTVGTVIAVGLLLLSFVRRSEALQRVSLEVLCVIALMTIPAYISGVGTEQMMLTPEPPVTAWGLMDRTPERIARHHDAAVSAFAMLVLAGGFAWLGLWQSRRIGRPGRITLGAVALLSILTLVAMARTATLGGEIRHPEIGDTAQTGGAITARAVADFVNLHTWAWPSMEVLHFIGLWLLFGVVLVVNLRLLGLMTDAPYAALHRLLPWAVLGLGINIFTGMLFLIAAPAYYAANPSFHLKIGMLLIAGADLLYLTTFDGPWHVAAGARAPRRVQAAALLAIVSWIGVMYFGRMLPFLGEGA